jgi:hypothetical protein
VSRYRFTVTLEVQGPVLSRAVEAGHAGVDAVPLRDRVGHEALPGTLVRGLLRESWETFGWTDRIADWLGADPVAARNPDKDSSKYHLKRSRLRFDDRWSVEVPGERHRYRHRIRIVPDTGAVSGGGLWIVETPFAPGETVRFTGQITAEAADEPTAKELRGWLEKGFRYLPAVGGLKGIGFGRLLGAAVGEPVPVATQRTLRAPTAACSAADAAPSTLALGLRIVPLDELCFPRPGPKGTLGNRYVTDDLIPGAALKAVLAHWWPEDDPLRKSYFDSLRITHALPVRRGRDQRPLAVPYSLAFRECKEPTTLDLCDFALIGVPRLIDGKAPRFQPDWKDAHWKSARTQCGWDDPPERRLRVRNAIDGKTGTVRYDQKTASGYLFSVETVVPDEHWWLANIQVPEVAPADRTALVEKLEGFLARDLAPLGKTKAVARVEDIGGPWPFSRCCGPLLRDDESVVIALQTPALLLPRELQCQPTNDGDTLDKAYAASWRELSRQTLELRHFFARQELGGGVYWWNRFRHKEPYRPVVLTQPGSIFVLDVAEGKCDEAERILTGWRDRGLPQLADVSGGEDWRANPWIAENGYGEVAINPTVHWELAAAEEPRA